MARIEDQAINIDHINQIGHLDRLFDVAEETVIAREEDELQIMEVAEFDLESRRYHVMHPATENVALIVDPKIFHGFMSMRYRVLEDLGAREYGYSSTTLDDFLEKCATVANGGWGIERDQLRCEWLVKKSASLSRAVVLGGDIVLGEETGAPLMNWYLSKFNVGERQNG